MKTAYTKGHKLDDITFSRISSFINREYGIELPLSKKIMVESRLQKRLRTLNMKSFSEYVKYIFSPSGKKTELISMIDLMTTNKTNFFREPDHFEYLQNVVLPELYNNEQSGEIMCNIWSCGCSSGEEAYTLAMVLSEFTEGNSSLKYQIKGTDISSDILRKGKTAVYTEKDIEPVPIHLRHKYLLKSKDKTKSLIKIKSEIRANVRFEHLNLMSEVYSISEMMDVVFFRNVAIYFSKTVQEEIINKICRHIKTGGHLFIGHSESLFNMDVPVKQVCPTVYRRL